MIPGLYEVIQYTHTLYPKRGLVGLDNSLCDLQLFVIKRMLLSTPSPAVAFIQPAPRPPAGATAAPPDT